MKTCIACGMLMERPDDFAMGDPAKDYCRHCQRPDGTMQSFEEKRRSLAAFAVRTQGLDESAALDVADAAMKNLPAWRDHYA